MPAAILLAAGASTRLGHPKQLVQLGGESLLERSIRIAIEADLEPILVILPVGRPDLTPTLSRSRVTLVENPDSSKGMSTSIQAGIRAMHGTAITGTIILACDQPAVTSAHLRRLSSLADRITASHYLGRNGIPAYFPSSVFSALLHLTGDKGARDLLSDAAALDLPDGDLDVDTEADLARARRLFPG